ncbi:MAG: 23S rRNA (guanosine(2251)-2'-O)-methyltransferase RlmB [Geminicoccaceae bacterium]
MAQDRRPKPGRRPPPRPQPRAADSSWLWGRHAVEAALANPRRTCLRLLATAPALERLAARLRPGLAVETVPPEAIGRAVGEDEVHQGLALQVKPLAPLALADAVPRAGPSLMLALDQVSDPRNAGAILRSAAAFGVDAVLVPERRSAELGGVAARAAAGGLDLVPLVEVVNLARALAALKEQGYWVVGLDGEAPGGLEALPDFARVVLVLGSEGHGLRRLVAEQCDGLARIAIDARIESLNVAVAAGIALHALRARLAAATAAP